MSFQPKYSISPKLLRYVEERLPRLAYKHVLIVVDRAAPEELLLAAVTSHGPRITQRDYELDAESGRVGERDAHAQEEHAGDDQRQLVVHHPRGDRAGHDDGAQRNPAGDVESQQSRGCHWRRRAGRAPIH